MQVEIRRVLKLFGFESFRANQREVCERYSDEPFYSSGLFDRLGQVTLLPAAGLRVAGGLPTQRPHRDGEEVESRQNSERRSAGALPQSRVHHGASDRAQSTADHRLRLHRRGALSVRMVEQLPSVLPAVLPDAQKAREDQHVPGAYCDCQSMDCQAGAQEHRSHARTGRNRNDLEIFGGDKLFSCMNCDAFLTTKEELTWPLDSLEQLVGRFCSTRSSI